MQLSMINIEYYTDPIILPVITLWRSSTSKLTTSCSNRPISSSKVHARPSAHYSRVRFFHSIIVAEGTEPVKSFLHTMSTEANHLVQYPEMFLKILFYILHFMKLQMNEGNYPNKWIRRKGVRTMISLDKFVIEEDIIPWQFMKSKAQIC